MIWEFAAKPRMRSCPSMKRLVVIVGPTASGKSALAIEAASLLEGEIVNCDSMQLHRGLSIGTAKPSADEQRRVPHHLFDILPVDEPFSAGRYMEASRRICGGIADRGRVPFVVGGTGLYLKALLEGIFEGPAADPPLRSRLRRMARRRGCGFLWRMTRRLDPAIAAKVQPRDELRLVRALEVFFLTGRRLSEVQQEREPLSDYLVLKAGLNPPREDLYDRIDRRVVEMFAGGLLDEVAGLLQAGYSIDSKGFEGLGYRHAAGCLHGDISVEEAVRLTQIESRRYAKRQLTWFRREAGMHWLPWPGDDPRSLPAFLDWFRSSAEWVQM